jgi:hypothetical protein
MLFSNRKIDALKTQFNLRQNSWWTIEPKPRQKPGLHSVGLEMDLL